MSILKAKIAFIQKKNRESKLSKSSFETTFSDLPEGKEDKNVSFTSEDNITDGIESTSEIVSEPSPTPSNESYRCSSKKKKKTDSEKQSSNNIMKNYCRGISNFAVSQTAVHYLMPLLQKNNIELEVFRKFIRGKKNKINCIKQLREMLLVGRNERKEVTTMKGIFKEITIIFLKYFTPNWVYHSKITDKYAHLKYRFKILRRVRNPVFFTYLQDFNN